MGGDVGKLTEGAPGAAHMHAARGAPRRALQDGSRGGMELSTASAADQGKYLAAATSGECPTIKDPKALRILGMRFLDPSLSQCTACRGEFTQLNRKHWCRRCGRIFCDSCTLKRQQLYTGGPPMRVCRACSTPVLFQLPIPTLQHVFSYFDSGTLSRAIRTCKRFQLGINLPFQEIRNIHEFYDKRATRFLQKGAFGSVYAAELMTTRAPAAIKVIDKYNVHTLREWAFIKREIELHSSLRHPNIVALRHVYQTRSKVYIVMDLGQGDLFDYMIKRGYMTEREVVCIAVQLLSALDYLHNVKHVVHRDVKPENILVFPPRAEQSSTGAGLVTVKLCDLGLAKSFQASADADEPSAVSCTPCGTLKYCPPEVLSKKTETTTDRLTKLDMFSLGIVLHVLVSGVEPFRGNSPDELLRSMRRPLETSGREWESVSAPFRGLVRSTLQYDSRLRPTAREALQHLYASGPCSAGSPAVMPAGIVAASPLVAAPASPLPGLSPSFRSPLAQPHAPEDGAGGLAALLAAAGPPPALSPAEPAAAEAPALGEGLGTTPLVEQGDYAQRIAQSVQHRYGYMFDVSDADGALVVDQVAKPLRRRHRSEEEEAAGAEEVRLGLECHAENDSQSPAPSSASPSPRTEQEGREGDPAPRPAANGGRWHSDALHHRQAPQWSGLSGARVGRHHTVDDGDISTEQRAQRFVDAQRRISGGLGAKNGPDLIPVGARAAAVPERDAAPAHA
eukprot:TRINITY_DN4802_c1_g1_i1.p1 TRINITY_DN4802_c1_g1~~TRINITY_DN4802_c1_g1_i1.p1  ORF type:complete len:735 (+),score=245.62 TRINITY_DN4802_c1_g1_i1:81-2285(+)